MKCSAIQLENVTENMLHPLLQQMFKMASLCMDTAQRCRLHSSVASSTTVSCMPDQTALRRCCSCSFKCFKEQL